MYVYCGTITYQVYTESLISLKWQVEKFDWNR